MAYAMNWVTGCPPCDDDCEKNSKMIRNHATYNVIIKNGFSYPSLHVSVEAAVALMVWYTYHLQTALPTSFVLGNPFGVQPLVHHHLPASGIPGAPARNHLQAMKYMTYKKLN